MKIALLYSVFWLNDLFDHRQIMQWHSYTDEFHHAEGIFTIYIDHFTFPPNFVRPVINFSYPTGCGDRQLKFIPDVCKTGDCFLSKRKLAQKSIKEVTQSQNFHWALYRMGNDAIKDYDVEDFDTWGSWKPAHPKEGRLRNSVRISYEHLRVNV